MELTAGQRGIWYAQQLAPDSVNFNAAEYLEIHGPVDTALFEQAVRRGIREAQTLQLRFHQDDRGPWQSLDPATADTAIPTVDLTTADDPQRAAHDWMRDDLGRLRDLRTAPPFTYALLKLAHDRFYWYQGYHHIAIDGFSARTVAARVAEIYTALAAGQDDTGTPLAPLTVLLDADAGYRASDAFEADRRYWTDTLTGRLEPTSLSGRPSPGVARSFRRHGQSVAPAEAARLRTAAARLTTNLAGLLVAATALHVSRLTGEEDVTLGLPALGRAAGPAHSVPGMMSNVLPLRLTVRPGMSVQELVDHSSVRVWEALRHQRYRAEDIRRDLRLANGEALYSLSINIMAFDYEITFAGLPVTAHNLSNGPFDDMSIGVYDRASDGSLRLAFDVDPELHDEDSQQAEARRFGRVLDWMATAPADAPVGLADLLSADERQLVVEKWNATGLPVGTRTFVELFEERVATAPLAPAVVFVR
ncbi:condensation domain-containing protein [Streptomyces sp. XY431]|uniref:condensation domain-containing protein n=1 Tax=Streptomyces sp. XY431 TaxID=1415562 RepID=UPI0006AF584F|nr:condensation domain-containing protein [Streptomyces sp. XY431]